VRLRWILVAIVVIALAPRQIGAFCQGVVAAAMTVFNELAVSVEEG
jgi:hypothetical protein